MILIFGGAYQGKYAYAKERFGDMKIVNEFHKWVLELVKEDKNVGEEVRRFISENRDTIVICDDISCGVVPADAEIRLWREAVGRSMAALAEASNEVIRLFCGIPTKIK